MFTAMERHATPNRSNGLPNMQDTVVQCVRADTLGPLIA
jgi:hypothetical protein